MSFSTKPRQRVSISFEGEISMTEQSHKDACDIHNILKKSEKTGILEHVNNAAPYYGEMPTGQEFHNHMNIIARAETMFETVPSKLRQRFENDPAKFLDYISDQKNYQDMFDQGIDVSHLTKPEPKTAPKTQVENSTEESLPSG